MSNFQRVALEFDTYIRQIAYSYKCLYRSVTCDLFKVTRTRVASTDHSSKINCLPLGPRSRG